MSSRLVGVSPGRVRVREAKRGLSEAVGACGGLSLTTREAGAVVGSLALEAHAVLDVSILITVNGQHVTVVWQF